MGVSVTDVRRFDGNFRLRYLGPRPIVEDASVHARRSLLVNAEAGYRVTPRARVVVDVLNAFNSPASDIDYFYRSRLAGEPAEGVDDIHTHPVAPRSARISLRFQF